MTEHGLVVNILPIITPENNIIIREAKPRGQKRKKNQRNDAEEKNTDFSSDPNIWTKPERQKLEHPK